MPGQNCTRVCRYDGEAVADAQRWLRGQWSNFRSTLNRRGIIFYGIRVAEPHHDGTPHWHLVMHVTAGRADDVTALLRGCWLEDDGDEPGAELHRVAIKGIDYHKGTATGYLAKYIAKNIDGTGVADDFEAEIDTASSIVRVDAWAATHGIRQFQQFGGPPIGLWRELRRLRSATSIDLIERARYAADQGDYAGFVEAVGGIVSGRKTLLHLWKQTVAGLNRYGERFRDRIVGLRTCTARLLTWFKQWRIISRDGLAAFLAALRSQGALSTAAPPVNAPEPEPGQQPSE